MLNLQVEWCGKKWHVSFFLLPCLSLLKHVHNFIPFRSCSPEALLTLPDPPHRHITHVLYRRKSWLLLSPSSQVKHFILKLNLSLIECSTMFSPQKATLSITNLHKYRQRSLWQCHPSNGYPSPCSGSWRAADELAGHAVPIGLCTC